MNINCFKNVNSILNRMATDDVTNTETPVTIALNGTNITSLKELRDNFNSDEVLKYFILNDLQLWLSQHYYDKEAHSLSEISIDTPNCLKKICDILGVKNCSIQNISEEEQAKINVKQQIVQSFTSDSQIMSELAIIAMNQEDLAELLNRGEKKIYLCNNSFSLPLRISGVTYIGIGNVIIESPFTEEQYDRNNIKVSGINLPSTTDAETESLALHIAKSNGYDDFAETHTPFSTVFYQKLKNTKYYNIYHLSFNTSVASEFFTSKHECEQAKENIIRKAYDDASKYLSSNSSKAISKEAAHKYSDIITDVFNTEVLGKLQSLSKLTHTSSAYTKLENLISKCYKNLLSQFDAELNESQDFYSLYDFNYFINQADIEEHDYRISEDGLLKVFETLFADNIQYTINNLFDVVNEIEKDLNDHASTFYNTAATAFYDYNLDIIKQLDEIGRGLDAIAENENLEEYLIRMCVSKAS